MATCILCPTEIERRPVGRPRQYCEPCRARVNAVNMAAAKKRWKAKGAVETTRGERACRSCGWSFYAVKGALVCPDCRDRSTPANSERVGYFTCVDCNDMRCVPLMQSMARKRCDGCRADAVARRKKGKGRHFITNNRVKIVARLRARDGDGCHLCGKRIDFALKWPHKMSNTVDHLVPVSRGGSDEDVNLALAHRICNERRGAGGEVQLRLIA